VSGPAGPWSALGSGPAIEATAQALAEVETFCKQFSADSKRATQTPAVRAGGFASMEQFTSRPARGGLLSAIGPFPTPQAPSDWFFLFCANKTSSRSGLLPGG